MMASPAALCPVTIRRNESAIEGLRNPVCDIAATKRHVVHAHVLHATGLRVEQLELAFWTVDQLIESAMGVINGDLPVPGAVCYQEWDTDAIQYTLQVGL